jgi:pectin methylesterase-like acyl-CoA thioesterase
MGSGEWLGPTVRPWMKGPMRAACLSAALGLSSGLSGCASMLTAAETNTLPHASAAAAVNGDSASAHWRRVYLGDWQPTVVGPRNAWVPDAVVALDGSGTHRTVQEAIDAQPGKPRASASGSAAVRRILIKPGVYKEPVCLRAKVPLVLYGTGDPRQTVVTADRYAGQRKPAGIAAHPCLPRDDSLAVGTFGSSTMIVHSDDVTLVGFTVANSSMDGVRGGQGYPEGASESGGAQGVALSLRGDRIHLQGMRLVGHQDTLLADQRPGDPRHRVYVADSVIAGDVDFIFGAARLVIEESLIISRSGRRAPGNGGYVLAPSTAHDEPHGFLVQRSRLLGQVGLSPKSINFGRPWDFGVPRGQWAPGRSPNGQALIRDSELGPHLEGWGRSTSWRMPDAQGDYAFRMQALENRRTVRMLPDAIP